MFFDENGDPEADDIVRKVVFCKIGLQCKWDCCGLGFIKRET